MDWLVRANSPYLRIASESYRRAASSSDAKKPMCTVFPLTRSCTCHLLAVFDQYTPLNRLVSGLCLPELRRFCLGDTTRRFADLLSSVSPLMWSTWAPGGADVRCRLMVTVDHFPLTILDRWMYLCGLPTGAFLAHHLPLPSITFGSCEASMIAHVSGQPSVEQLTSTSPSGWMRNSFFCFIAQNGISSGKSSDF